MCILAFHIRVAARYVPGCLCAAGWWWARLVRIETLNPLHPLIKISGNANIRPFLSTDFHCLRWRLIPHRSFSEGTSPSDSRDTDLIWLSDNVPSEHCKFQSQHSIRPFKSLPTASKWPRITRITVIRGILYRYRFIFHLGRLSTLSSSANHFCLRTPGAIQNPKP